MAEGARWHCLGALQAAEAMLETLRCQTKCRLLRGTHPKVRKRQTKSFQFNIARVVLFLFLFVFEWVFIPFLLQKRPTLVLSV